jgi:hypothetical protein
MLCPTLNRRFVPSRLMHRSKLQSYSAASSANASSAGGTASPSSLVVLGLMTDSNFVGCPTGRSVGRMLGV